MDNYTTYCTEEQVRHAIGLGAPIKLFCKDYIHGHINYIGSPISIGHVLIHNDLYYAPTTEQMIGWLEQQIDILSIEITFESQIKWKWELFTENTYDMAYPFYSRKEATLAAIDAALEYLENLKQ